jgi:hypothetical protein
MVGGFTSKTESAICAVAEADPLRWNPNFSAFQAAFSFKQ